MFRGGREEFGDLGSGEPDVFVFEAALDAGAAVFGLVGADAGFGLALWGIWGWRSPLKSQFRKTFVRSSRAASLRSRGIPGGGFLQELCLTAKRDSVGSPKAGLRIARVQRCPD